MQNGQFLKQSARVDPCEIEQAPSRSWMARADGAESLSGLSICLELERDVLTLGEVCLEPQCNGGT